LKRNHWWNSLFKDINGVIRFLIVSDIVFQGAVGLFGPLFALYISQYITDTDPIVATGIASAIYLIVKSVAQIPAAWVIDKVRGERDDFFILLGGTLLVSLVPISYLYIDTALQLYIVQAIYGLITAVTFPSYMAIFTRHIDHGKEGTEWGVYYTLVDVATATTAAIGGTIAAVYGFATLIWISAVFSLFGAFLLIPIRPYLKMKK
ncbi:MAG: MFS transporter, partial [Minisyncoccia bacterium]